MSNELAAVANCLRGDAQLLEQPLALQLGHCQLHIRSNSSALLDRLGDYFEHVRCAPAAADIVVQAIERPLFDCGLRFADWKREPGKTGRKDAYCDLPGTSPDGPPAGRVVHKVRTGMLFLQSEADRIAAGPCLRYDNQVINFINSQYMNWLQHRGWLICHAAGLVHDGHALGLAGFSGGGKSTLMLKLLEDDAVGYLTNDRLFIRRAGDGLLAAGIPKLPRINPGTIVHNPRLAPLIAEPRRSELLALPADELWALEEKHDVSIRRQYGDGRIVGEAPLSAFWVLNWRRDDDRPVQLQRIDIAQRPDLLGAIMKSPGPFYQYTDGRFLTDDQPLPADDYIQAMAGLPVYEVTGGIDFEALSKLFAGETT